MTEIASHLCNSELSTKPLVLLFAGPPGHGKTETAKQLAKLLDAPYWKVDCRNHAHPWVRAPHTVISKSISNSQVFHLFYRRCSEVQQVISEVTSAHHWETLYQKIMEIAV